MPGKFKPKNGSPVASIRSDQIYWFDEKVDDHCVNIRLIIKTVTFIAMRLIDIPYRLACRSKARLTCYPGDGARYVKHDGGSLRLFPSNAPAGTHFGIEPFADNLVIFWSDSRNPHEILPTSTI
uniref:Prolyl 4-hydroxylase alpha subunit Fe(2+) 2OG dioxygenase domain-containing protein n=1 Tax=Romanomermis culicivorax TaxID=13658 RepID=A0A915ICT8_ROMCU